jgi:SsrA-binding protein
MAKPTKGDGPQLILQNRRASFTYELGERYEAGIALTGSEVKTLREGGGDLTDTWIDVEGTRVWLKGMFLPQLPHMAFGHEPRRARLLLLRHAEIDRIRKALTQKGMTAVPTRLYWKNGRVKVELAMARGKVAADKRHAIRKRDLDREARAEMARARKGRLPRRVTRRWGPAPAPSPPPADPGPPPPGWAPGGSPPR